MASVEKIQNPKVLQFFEEFGWNRPKITKWTPKEQSFWGFLMQKFQKENLFFIFQKYDDRYADARDLCKDKRFCLSGF